MKMISIVACIGVMAALFSFPVDSFLFGKKQAILVKPESSLNYSGLTNLGNTCYMNSVIQSLFHIKQFRENICQSIFQKGSIGQSLQDLFISMQNIEFQNVDTNPFVIACEVNRNIQEDAQEFMLKLINKLDNCKQQISNETDDNNNNDHNRHHHHRLSLSSLFTGSLQQSIECINVNFTKIRHQKFLDLSLDITSFQTLNETIANYMKRELFTGENQYRTKEYGLQDASKSISISKLPSVLHIHLKRFSYNVETDNMIKGYPTMGHYYCFIRPDAFKEPDVWYKFNDCMVSKTSVEDMQDKAFGGTTFRMFGVGTNQGYGSCN
eukprot:gene8803-18212_t